MHQDADPVRGGQSWRLTRGHKEDACAEDDVVLVAVEPSSADAEPAEEQQDGTEDREDAGGAHDAWVGQETEGRAVRGAAVLGVAMGTGQEP